MLFGFNGVLKVILYDYRIINRMIMNNADLYQSKQTL